MDHLSRVQGEEGESRSTAGAKEGTLGNWIWKTESKRLRTSLWMLGGSPHGKLLQLRGAQTGKNSFWMEVRTF